MVAKRRALGKLVKVSIAIIVVFVGLGVIGAVFLPLPSPAVPTTTTSSSTASSATTTTPSSTSSVSSTTTSSIATSTSTSLYFQVTCVGCSVGSRSAGTVCGGVVFGSWIGKPWYQSEFGGELDYYDPRIGTVGLAVFGNGSATYLFPPSGEPLQSPPPNYQGTPPNASFKIISCQGTLQVKLMSTNGSVVWQATAYPTALNSTVSYIFP